MLSAVRGVASAHLRFLVHRIFFRVGGYLEYLERSHLRRMPRHQTGETSLFGRRLVFVDANTYLHSYSEIFKKEIYRFRTEQEEPLIIDCGANIGMSVIYFKQLYPHAVIEAFEPDPIIYEVCRCNLDSFGLDNVQLFPEAIWHSDTIVDFQVEGAFSGRIPKPGDDANLVTVPTRRLRSLLNRRVDFLKIDIEGAEYEALRDSEDLLCNVDRIFVEYHSHIEETQRLDEILRILTHAGFRYHIHAAYTAKNPFLCTPPLLGMDLQLNIFGFRPERQSTGF